ncbi:MAG: PilZ domain-containing protein [Planctomycetota bacterium]|jgi:hypothetical protein
MIQTGTRIFLQRPEEMESRTLHPVTVEGSSVALTVRLASGEIEITPGEDLMVYFDRGVEFMKQPARAAAAASDDEGQVISLQLEGEPVSAESRQCYRVSTVLSNLTAVIGDETCMLTDVSVQGCSVVSSAEYVLGQPLAIEVRFEGRQISGQTRVQSIKRLPDDRTRYGLLCTETKGELGRGLMDIAMKIQRQQLRRRAAQ